MRIEIAREFEHKRHGEIGAVRLVFDGELTLGGKTLGENATEYLVNAGLDRLQQAYGQAEKREEALEAFRVRLGKILDDTIGTRSTPDDFERFRLAVIRERLSAPKRKAYDGLGDQKAKTDYLRSIFNNVLDDDDRAETDVIAQVALDQSRERKSGIAALKKF